MPAGIPSYWSRFTITIFFFFFIFLICCNVWWLTDLFGGGKPLITCFFELLQYHQNLIVKADRSVYTPSNLQCLGFHNPSLYDKRSIDRNFLEVSPADYVCHSIQHLQILFLQSVSAILKPYLFVEDREVFVDCHASRHQQFLFVLFAITQLYLSFYFLAGNM